VTGEPDQSVRFEVLGPLVVRAGERALAPASSTRRALLGLLLLADGRALPAERLLRAVWGDEPPDSGRAAVHVAVSRLRAWLELHVGGAAALDHDAGGYRLQVPAGSVDATRFRALAAESRQAASPEERLRRLCDALALWRGQVVGETAVPFTGDVLVRQLERLRVDAACELADAALAGREPERALACLEATADAYPFDERTQAALAVVLAACGRQAEALGVVERARARLVDELGLDPGPHLQVAHLRILRQQVGHGGTGAAAQPPRAAAARGQGRPVPMQLPPDVAEFTGRDAELAALRARLGGAAGGTAPTVAISAIDGKPGVGKSALAVHLAHGLAAGFPDGVLYVNLRGTALERLPPLEVLGQFLRALGASDEEVPGDLDAATARTRSLLAGRRLLVVLDNAADAAQVRPLLPATAGCAALITSRAHLADLDGADPLTLDLLPEPDAVALLAKLAGRERVDAEPAVAANIVTLCGRLPLAVRIAGVRLRSRPAWPLAALAERLADARRRLDELAVGDLAVRSSFLLSYRALGAPTDRTFRLLGLVHGPDVAPGVVAALTGDPAAERDLERLADAQLLETPAPGRYRFHDLLRLFARERADAEEDERQRQAAVDRALAWYLVGTWRAVALLGPAGAAEADPAAPGPAFADRAAALAWLDAELANLVAAAQQAADGPVASAHLAWRLSNAVWPFLHLRKSWSNWRAVCEAAIRAAERSGEEAAAAAPLNSLGVVHAAQHRYQEAAACYRRSLAIRRRAGDRLGTATVLNNLGDLRLARRRHREAVRCLELSLTCLEGLGDRRGEGIARNNLGRAWLAAGRPGEALAHLTRGLADLRAAGDREAEAEALNNLGQVHTAERRHREAAACHRQSLALCRELGDRFQEANAHRGLGSVAAAVAGPPAARPHWQAALAIFQRLDAPEAEDLRRLLGSG
jgi:DNA-binding SARP family transcriptional activator/tetratricopeptide (TPR) repeat protein